ncbi:ankyrin repeat domain-containing protein 40-like isoform X2 [Acanthaster planci]|uniref:Ankyrin repeat domain-containing protein 40-like isoform X2 n=1 Tax=Acanthaster planci TaxID=133434 RepID=A0A8B7ZSL5_ACAPL|nr:ankyrin repeat domain-containing protein 40-like isoform X2 [Acanthaster planci]
MDDSKDLEDKFREAASIGDQDMLDKLLQLGVNVNAQHRINGWTALHWASKRGHPTIVRHLLTNGADRSLTNGKGETAAQLTDKEEIHSLLGELVLKVRVANSAETDFIEIEIDRNERTFSNLVLTCCRELNCEPETVVKVRKLPNTILRKDKDVWRLTDFQELEIVLQKFSGGTRLQNAFQELIY